MAMLVILQISFVFYWKFRPYAYQSLNYLELAGIACSTAVLLAGIIFHVPPSIAEDARKSLSTAILVLMIGYLVTILFAVMYEYGLIRKKSLLKGN
ncbi:hypothetical protein BKA69DRAFT_761699 [Paraphysoderma sedebokerense]|nr:hypothetical protein BKA69DRAFT_761699 [Paraphysoderma sedebokerense]